MKKSKGGYKVTYAHAYQLMGFDRNAPRRHGCLGFGIWCWSNLWEHPLDLFAYLKKKL